MSKLLLATAFLFTSLLVVATTPCRAQEPATRQVATLAYLCDIAQADHALILGQVSRAEAILDRCPKELRQWEWYYLKRQCDCSLHGWRVTEDEKSKCVLSPDGTKVALLAPATDDKPRRLTVFNAIDGKVLTSFDVPGTTTSVAFHPDGTQLAYIQDQTGKPLEIHLRDAATGKSLKTLPAAKDAVKKWFFATDGKRLDGRLTILSPDGRWLAYIIGAGFSVNSRDGIVERHFSPSQVQIWPASTDSKPIDKPAQTWVGGDRESFKALSFSPDGKRLAVGISATKHSISVRTFPGGEELATLHGAPASPDQIRFSPDGTRVVAGCSNGALAVWTLPVMGKKHRDLTPDLILHGHRVAIASLGLLDANRAVSLDAKSFVKTWDIVQSPRVVQVRLTADDFFHRWTAPTFSPDGKELLLANSNGPGTSGQFVQIDAFTGKTLLTMKSRPLFGYDISYHPNGKYFVSTGADRAVHVCKTDTGETVARFTKQELPHRSRFTPDGEKVLVHSSGTSAVLWDWRADKIVYSVSGFGSDHHRDYDFSPDGKYLSAASLFRNEIYLWDARTGKFLRSIKPTEKGYALRYVRFNPDSKSLASGQASKLTLWNSDDGAVHWKPKPLKGKVKAGEKLSDLATRDVAFSPDGKYLAAMVRGRSKKDAVVVPEIVIWDLAQRKEIQTLFLKGTEHVQEICFSPDGGQMAAIDDCKRLYLWDWKAGKQVFPPVDIDLPRADFADPTGLCFTPDGKMLAVAIAAKLDWRGFGLDPAGVVYYDRATGKKVTPFPERHQGGVTTVAYSPDGSWYATGGHDATVRLWDSKTGNHLRVLGKAPSDIWSIVVAPDGKRLAAADLGKGLKIWDIPSGKEIDALPKKAHGFLYLASSPDSKLLAAAGYLPNRVLLLDFTTGKEVGELQFKGEKSVELCCIAFHPKNSQLWTGIQDRSALKKSFFQLIFAKNRFQSPLKTLFEKLFPNVAEVVRALKGKDHTFLPRLMQHVEANFVINTVCRRLMDKFPDAPVVTIHDSLLTTPPHADTIRRVMLEEFDRIGLAPTLHFKRHGPTAENAIQIAQDGPGTTLMIGDGQDVG